MSAINYNYNYENRSTSTQSIVWSNAEITNCTYAQMQASTPENGYFYHTTDTGKFYFAWGGEYIELNVTGDSDISALVSQAQQALNDANAAVSAATSAATAAQNAAEAVSANAAHFTDTTIHITSSERDVWNAKQNRFTNESVLSGITASQVSSWEAVAAGSYDVSGAAASALSSAKDYADSLASNYDVAGAASSALSSAKEYTNTQISGLNWVKSVNGTNGDVIVRTFTEVPDSVENGSEIYTIRKNGTLKDFCDDLKDYLNPEAGTAYLAEVSFNAKHNGEDGYDANNAYNNIGLPDTLGNGELIVYVPIGCDDGPVFELEMHSTNGFDKDYSISGKWMTMYDSGSVLSPWKGFMTASFEETTSDGYQYIAQNDTDGISKYYLEHIYSPLTSTQVSTLSAISANASVLSGISQADIENWNNDATGVSEEFVTSTIATSLIDYAKTSDVSTAISTAVSGKLNVLPVVDEVGNPGYGYPYWIPYDTSITPEASKLSVTLKCLTLDNNLTKMSFDKELAGATVSTAGVMTAADKTKLDGISTVSLPSLTDISQWGDNTSTTSLPRVSDGDASKFVTANDVIAFIEEAIKKKSEVDDGGSESGDDSDYLYISGYTEGSTATIINQMNKFKIELTDNTYAVEVVAPAEGEFLAGNHDEYIRFNFSVPSGYTLTKFELDDLLLGLVEKEYTNNGSVSYNNDSKSYTNYSRTPGSTDELLESGFKYKITITKNN